MALQAELRRVVMVVVVVVAWNRGGRKEPSASQRLWGVDDS